MNTTQIFLSYESHGVRLFWNGDYFTSDSAAAVTFNSIEAAQSGAREIGYGSPFAA
jgi:hypothetical protein